MGASPSRPNSNAQTGSIQGGPGQSCRRRILLLGWTLDSVYGKSVHDERAASPLICSLPVLDDSRVEEMMVLPQTTLLVRVLKAKLRARAYRIFRTGTAPGKPLVGRLWPRSGRTRTQILGRFCPGGKGSGVERFFLVSDYLTLCGESE